MDDITIGVTENVNLISVTAQPNDQIIDIAVTETVETVLLDVSTTVQEVSVTATQNVIVENITVDYVSNENHIDINVTDATQDVTLNVTPTLIEINILRSGGEVNILQFDSLADFPSTGSSDYFYLAKDTNKLYRWTGSAYAEISATGNAVWGEIIGTLSEQTDLQNALNLKAPINSPTFTGTVSGITKAMVGLGAVDNTSDLDKPISTATQTALNAKQPLDGDLTSIAGLSGTAGFLKKNGANSWNLDTSTYLTEITSSDVTTALGYTPEDSANKGIAGGYASLDGAGKVPSSELPSYVDDVVEVANYASLPSTGETGKIYITLDTNKIYRWSGSVYVEISAGASVWGGITGTLSNQTDLQSALDAKQDDLNGTGFVKSTAGTISYDNTVYYPDSNPDGYTSNTGTVTSVALTAPSAFSVSGSPITSSGTLAITGAGTTAQYVRGDGTLATLPDVSGYVPYTGATGNVDLGTHTIIAEKGTFSSSGSGDTVGITHSSGSGIALNISKGGNGEGLYINKTSGSGNAATIIGTLNATTLVKSGGTSSQFLKADGSVDSSTYLTSASLSGYVATSGDQSISGVKTFTDNTKLDGDLYLKQDSGFSSITGYNSITSDSDGFFLRLDNGKYAYLSFAISTSGYNYLFPNKQGTFALTSDLSSYLPLTGGTLTGALNGTTISLTNSASSNALVVNQNSGFTALLVNQSGTGSGITITNTGNTDGLLISHTGGRGIRVNSDYAGYGIIVNNDAGATSIPFTIQKAGANKISFTDAGAGEFASTITATQFIKSGGTSAQFLKADGSIDSSTYLTTGSASSSYLPLSGGTLTGALEISISAPVLTLNGSAGSAIDTIRFNSSGATYASIISNGGSGEQRYSIGPSVGWGGYHTFFTDTSERMRITSSGNVGIGTSSPINGGSDSKWVTLDGNSYGGGFVSSVSGNAKGYLYYDNSTTSFTMQGASSVGLAFLTNNTEKMRITSGGYVGINTTSPSTLLHVSGTSTQLTLQNVNGGANAERIGMFMTSGDTFKIISLNDNNTTRVDNILVANVLSGNVGIGTTSPNSLFEINKSSNSGSGSAFPRINVINSLATQGDGSSTYNFADIHLSSGNGAVDMYMSTTYAAGTWAPAGIINVASNHDLQFKTNNTERMRITSGGNVGIGITSPNEQLHVVGGIKSQYPGGNITMYGNYTSGNAGFDCTNGLIFVNGGTERMRINSGGDVKFALNITFGTTSEMYMGRGNAISGAYNSYDFVMSNFQASGRIVMTASTSGSSGMYLAQGSNSWAAWSDERLKTNLVPIDNAAEKVSQLRAMTGRYKTDDESVSRSFLIAQDVLAVLPEATDLDESTGMYAVQYTDVIPLLVASIKELKSKIETLENK